MKRIAFLLLFLVLTGASLHAQIPVILRVSASEQSDTIGCNFVRELCRVTYSAILSGKAKLWNSPSKEICLMAESLKGIEVSTGTSFVDQEVIFIYEYWSNANKELKSSTTGFLFSNKNKRGEDVEYGYVEYKDLQESFLRDRVETNANGNFNANVANFLNAKSYNYNFLQFAGKVIDNVSDSRKIRDEFTSTMKFNTSAFSLNEVPQKQVIYTVDASTDLSTLKASNSAKLLQAIDKYLHSNEEMLYNLGGEKIITRLPKASKWKVTRVMVNELWKKIGGQVMYDPLAVTIYLNDSALTEIPYKDLVKMEVKVDEISIVDYLRIKNFNYVIRMINSQEIPRSENYLYQKALLTTEWNKITTFVHQQ